MIVGLIIVELGACDTLPLTADNVWRMINLDGDTKHHAGLRVDVTPTREISILIDHDRVATTSPFETWELKPGEHTLTVRAMGYHSVDLPLTLAAGKTTHVPVALRAR